MDTQKAAGRSTRMRRLATGVLAALCAALSSTAGSAQAQETDISDMSLEELLNVEITSVSKKAEKRTEAAAAIYVLTSEDIRRSGATSIPELLRTVPGLNIAKIDSSKWSVTARGSAGRFANKLLVLIDGRSIYTPFFSGVYWEANDVMLEDVERIEVIRGPGGTLWGANAVNGVINIITKKASDTQGGLLSVGAGTEERGFGSFRYGGRIGDKGNYRFYTKYFNRDEGGSFYAEPLGLSGGSANDDWQMGQIGFRADFDLSDDETLTIQGDTYRNRAGVTHDLVFFTAPAERRINSTTDYHGANLLARWNKKLRESSDIQLQFYWSFYSSEDIVIEEERHTLDLDFQHTIALGERHDLVYGFGFRITFDEFDNTAFQTLSPDTSTNDIISAFIQDQITLTDTFKLTLGSKFEHNDYTGIEIQPSARFAWTPNERHTLWGAISRAVRTPTRAERDMRLNFFTTDIVPGAIIAAIGDSGFDSEELLAYELGYRVRLSERAALDIAVFYNEYDNLRFAEMGTPFLETTPPPDHIILPFILGNGASASTRGIEVSLDYSPKPWWFVRASYSLIDVEVEGEQDGSASEGDAPENTFMLQNRWDLPHNLEFDTILRYVDKLPALDISEYITLDARLAWHPNENLELAIVGQNLIESGHPEFAPTVVFTVPTEVERGVYGKITWNF